MRQLDGYTKPILYGVTEKNESYHPGRSNVHFIEIDEEEPAIELEIPDELFEMHSLGNDGILNGRNGELFGAIYVDGALQFDYYFPQRRNEHVRYESEQLEQLFAPALPESYIFTAERTPHTKLYRTPEGTQLAVTLAELAELTRDRADEYYTDGEIYVFQGQRYLLDRPDDWSHVATFYGLDGQRSLSTGVHELGTFLPDVASDGLEITRWEPPQREVAEQNLNSQEFEMEM